MVYNPKYNKSQAIGAIGETFFKLFVHQKLGWVFRSNPSETDFGFDGFIDIVDGNTVTGMQVAVQIKCGDSFYNKKHADGIKFYGENKHLNYYLNSPIPVLIILYNSECTEGKWVQFKLEDINITKSGWWIELPNQNELSAKVKETWGEIVGQPIDYGSIINRYTKLDDFFEFMPEHLLTLIIEKDEVEQSSLQSIKETAQAFQANTTLLQLSRGNFEIYFSGYDDDKREVYEIPEIRRWYKKSLYDDFPWFYFLGANMNATGLKNFYLSCMSFKIIKRSDQVVLFELPSNQPQAQSDWLTNSFHALNKFCELNGIPESIIKERSMFVGEVLKDLLGGPGFTARGTASFNR